MNNLHTKIKLILNSLKGINRNGRTLELKVYYCLKWHVSKTVRVFFRFFILINGLPIHIFFLIFLINYYTRMFDLSYSGIGCLKKMFNSFEL